MVDKIETPVSDALSDLSKRDRWKVTTRIRVNATENPKKNPSMAYDRFKGYFKLKGDCVVQDALDKGLRMDDIRHDAAHGFISLAEEGKEFVALAGREMVEGDL